MNSKNTFIIIFILAFISCKTKYNSSSSVYVKDGTLTECKKKVQLKPIKTNKINNEFLEISFNLRLLPDNLWFVEFHKDGTYEYKYWSGWGNSEGEILEKGTYIIRDNKIHTKTQKKDKNFSFNNLYIFQTQNQKEENCPECIFDRTNKYCLTKKNKLFIVEKIIEVKEIKLN